MFFRKVVVLMREIKSWNELKARSDTNPSIAETPFIITDLMVNGEFRPALMLAGLSDQLVPLRLPMKMDRGSSLAVVLRAPASRAPLDCCYPKPPVSLVVTTDRGTFTFQAGTPIPRAVSPA